MRAQVATLHIKSGPLAGQRIPVTGELVIGRQNADLIIDDTELSRRHLIVRLLDDGLEVEDLDSTNGTLVDDRRIEGPTRVGGGARVKLGATLLEVEGVLPVQGTRLSRQIADPEVTRARSIPADVTRARPAQSPAPAQPAAAALPAAPAPTAHPAEPAAVAPDVGDFRLPARKRGGGLASRSWVPVVLSFGTVVLVAIALVIYFASR